MSEQTQEQAELIAVLRDAQDRLWDYWKCDRIQAGFDAHERVRLCANELERRPSPPQAFDPGLWWQTESQRKIYAEYAARRDALAAAPSPPAPDIAQIRAQFEAIYPCPEVLRGPGYSQWLARFDGYCAALGVKP